MYADKVSDAMKQAIGETERRRKIQKEYNEKYGITPKTIIKKVETMLERKKDLEIKEEKFEIDLLRKKYNFLEPKERNEYIKILEKQMAECAKNLEFEKAALIRDEIKKTKEEFSN